MTCPYCSSAQVHVLSTYPTKNHDPRRMYECKDCFAYFSETKNTLLEDLKTHLSVIGASAPGPNRRNGIECDGAHLWDRQEHGVGLGATVCRVETGVVPVCVDPSVPAGSDRRGRSLYQGKEESSPRSVGGMDAAADGSS